MRVVRVFAVLATAGRVAVAGAAPTAGSAPPAPVSVPAPTSVAPTATTAPTLAPTAPTNAASAAAPATSQLSLEDAVKLALTRNERAAIADANIDVASAGVVKARVAFLPVVSLTGNYTVKPFDKSPINSGVAQLGVSQPVIAPSAFPLYAQAKNTLAAELEQAKDDKRRLAFDAAKAYIAVQLADDVAQAAQRQLDLARSDLNDTSAQFQAQLVSSNDVTRAQVSVAEAQRELVSDQANLAVAWIALEFVCNANVPHNLAPPTALLTAGQQQVADVGGLVTSALAHRPDLEAHKYTGIAAHDFAREPRYRFFPTLTVQAVGTLTSAAPPTGHDLDAALSALLSWEIYDAGSRDADAQSRDAQAVIADLNTQTLARQVDSDVRTAVAQLIGAQAAYQAANDSAVASRKSADEEGILYHQGLAKALELIEANDERFEAEVNAAGALSDVANAYLALRLALGEDPVDGLSAK